MEHKFKIGDRVMCINEENSSGSIKQGEVYTVVEYPSLDGNIYDLICIKDEVDGHPVAYATERFELINTTLEPQNIVQLRNGKIYCVSTAGRFLYDLPECTNTINVEQFDSINIELFDSNLRAVSNPDLDVIAVWKKSNFLPTTVLTKAKAEKLLTETLGESVVITE